MSIQCGEHLQRPAPSRAHNCDPCGASCLSLPLAACFELHEKRHRVNAPLLLLPILVNGTRSIALTECTAVPVIQSTAISLGNSLRRLQSSNNILSGRVGRRTGLMRVTVLPGRRGEVKPWR